MNDIIKATFGGSSARDTLGALLELNAFINEFKARERRIEYRGLKEGYERNAEHTFQVEFIVLTLNVDEELGYDQLGLILKAKFHDLVEWLEGDTPMFPEVFRGEPKPDSVLKRAKEERAYNELRRRFGSRYPWMIEAVRSYLDLADEESVFVSAIGKLVAVMNIYQDDGRSWRKRGIPLSVAYEYHREDAWRHPLVKRLYEELWGYIRADAKARPNLYVPEVGAQHEQQRRSE